MELSTLDMRLRRLILHATLDIEHFLKVQLIRDVSSNPVEDGYQIVEKFFSENSSVKNSISENRRIPCARILWKSWKVKIMRFGI